MPLLFLFYSLLILFVGGSTKSILFSVDDSTLENRKNVWDGYIIRHHGVGVSGIEQTFVIVAGEFNQQSIKEQCPSA